jgi:phosphocarrier protein HPr
MSGATLRRTVEIINERGLHARASAKLVKLAAQFDAQVKVSREGSTVDAQSIMGLMMLGAGIGSTIDLKASGPQAEEAMDALTQLIADRFHEER